MNFPSKARLAHIVFESDDKASKAFDVILLILIFISVSFAVLDSVREIKEDYGPLLYILEWGFTIVFTVEYLMRIWLSRKAIRYILSFYGMVDLLAILPTYLSLFIVNTQLFAVIRALRFLRILRILKMGRHLRDGQILILALKNSQRKIQIFIGTVLTIVLIMGTLMYLIEGPENGFTSIPISMYWAIVTLTTVGFGDITPMTPWGKFAATIIMLIGYAIIAVPTGIVSSELSAINKKEHKGKNVSCPTCNASEHDADAFHCKHCGTRL